MPANTRAILTDRTFGKNGQDFAKLIARSVRAVRSFFKTAGLFIIGLSLVLWVVDSALGWSARRSGWRKLPGTQVYESQIRARRPGPNVKAIYFGDSVARQLFRPGQEPGEDVRYLASTGAIGLAGQYYLLEESLVNCPGATDVYLFLTPGALANDLSPPFGRDYFCEFFHRPRQVAEVFHARRDANLLAAHIGRMLLPGLMAENTRRWATSTDNATSSGSAAFFPTGNGREPLLDLCDRFLGTTTIPPPLPGEIALSPTSKYFLPKMRELCRAHDIRLHMLPCPVSDNYRFDDREHLFDGEIIYRPATQFRDGLHLKPQFLTETRHMMVEKYRISG